MIALGAMSAHESTYNKQYPNDKSYLRWCGLSKGKN